MSTLGERKCALLLLTLRSGDRRRLLARLPTASSRSIRRLISELEDMPIPVSDLAGELLGQKASDLTASTSLDLDQLILLSTQLSPAWYARVLSVWTGIDRSFCLDLLDKEFAEQVRSELTLIEALPTRLADALKAEVMTLVSPEKKAA